MKIGSIKMIKIAVLGFGVVGGGVCKLITDNYKEVTSLGGDGIEIKHILDLRDFPDSPFADKIVHDFSVIENDPEVSVVIEAMGGSHPAYEYTVAALKSGKSVVTSNKEVVAKFGEEFLALAKENGVSYRFEAAVGGGIPVISPVINCVCQNKIGEIRGILNGTTNYILTQMFTYGQSFDAALSDAQKKGYAEANPDADILGTDACRKIAILTALVTGKLISTELIHTEGITKVRLADVKSLESIGATVKLVGRCIVGEGAPTVAVAPFVIKNGEPLSGVNGVYNAVEVMGDPLGNVMFYGQGAGAGATASAVVGDLMQIMNSGINCKAPVFERSESIAPFESFVCRHYLAFDKKEEAAVMKAFANATVIVAEECAIITEPMAEGKVWEKINVLGVKPLSHIRELS